jgi:ubiquinone/menaquinone biosynthesis C-methylase UbiE
MDETTRQKKARSFWDKLASGYDKATLRTYEDAYSISIRKTCSVLSADQHVLDVGCGTGIISLAIAPRVKIVVGTDISPEMIAIARSKAERQGISNVNFRVYDGYSLPYEDMSFDTVLLFNMLYIVKEPVALLREAHRLLKPLGNLVSATDCYAEPVPLTTRLTLNVKRLLNLVGIIPFIWYFTKQDVHQLFERFSFEIIETDVLHAVPVNYYILARKV